jgi:outer membrane protein assembly factor BamB
MKRINKLLLMSIIAHILFSLNNDSFAIKVKWSLDLYKKPLTKDFNMDLNASLVSSPAIGTDGTIYVGSYDRNLYAINPDGSIKWKYTTKGDVESSPAIGKDETIYVGSSDNNLYAINSDGTLKWSFMTEGDVSSSPAIGAGGTIYVGSNDKKLYAINANGTMKWSFIAYDGDSSYGGKTSPAIGVDGTIYYNTGYFNSHFYALNPDGTVKWFYDFSSNTTSTSVGDFSSSPAISSNGTIYVGRSSSSSYKPFLYGFDSDGNLIGDIASYGSYSTTSPAIGSDGTVYIGIETRIFSYELYAINPENSFDFKWSTRLCKFSGDPASIGSPGIGYDGMIYIGNKYFTTISPDGSIKNEFEGNGPFYSSPVIAPDGTIYAGTTNGYFYAFSTESQGLADSDWPMFRHNIRNTASLMEEKTECSIKGQVITDMTGNSTSVSGAIITIIDNNQYTTSDKDGYFTFSNIIEGNYSLKIEKQGFQTLLINDIAIQLTQTTQIPAQKMSVQNGECTQEVLDNAISSATANLLNPDGTRVIDGTKMLYTQEELNQKLSSMYTEEQLIQKISEIIAWGDLNNDGKIGLEEAIRALLIVSEN